MTAPIARRFARGAVAGLIATATMSAVMALARRAGLVGKHPPEEITERTLDAAGARPEEPTKDALATAAHLAFGMGAGGLYGLLPVPRRRSGGILVGTGYGLAVWAVSYAGWLPAFGLMPSPARDRSDRQATMVASHLVYGATLGGLLHRLPGGATDGRE